MFYTFFRVIPATFELCWIPSGYFFALLCVSVCQVVNGDHRSSLCQALTGASGAEASSARPNNICCACTVRCMRDIGLMPIILYSRRLVFTGIISFALIPERYTVLAPTFSALPFDTITIHCNNAVSTSAFSIMCYCIYT